LTIHMRAGDCRDVLPTLEPDSFDCVVTSPPYFGLRDYGVAGQIGLEPTLDAYVEQLCSVFDALWRVLKPSGTAWLNLGDSYASPPTGNLGNKITLGGGQANQAAGLSRPDKIRSSGLKPKDLCGVPWRVAFALQSEGWWLRSAIVWAKPNPMPESVTDRPTSSYEMVFLLTKSERYFYDADAIAEPLRESSIARLGQDVDHQEGSDRANGGRKTNGKMKAVCFGGTKGQGSFGSAARRASGNEWVAGKSRNARNVWTIATQPFSGAHFATMPPDLAERCIKAGCPIGGHVLDPFAGAGTTGLVADRLQRDATLIDLSPAYGDMAASRITDDSPLFVQLCAAPAVQF
jgi:DNA modification methylase